MGFKIGGLFIVGGSGGMDLQFVLIMVMFGEQVDIWWLDEVSVDWCCGGGLLKVVNVNFFGIVGCEGIGQLLFEIQLVIGDGYILKLV